ncbi:MAG TPA: hypothetical protein DDY22_20750 [Geobacter sp.]|nr:hypothetical protein [Geobacter sp.]
MPITVNVGEILECAQNDEIRTRGCDPCVGLIVIYDTGGGSVVKRCAHFSVGLRGPYTQAKIDNVLNPILANHFGKDHIVAAGFTWGGQGAGMGSAFICNNLARYFGDFNAQHSAENDSITTNSNVIEISNNALWDYTYDPSDNASAELNSDE